MDNKFSGFWEGKKVLVTGGASFIGSHLTELLVHHGAHVRVADDLSSGKLENLEEVRAKVEFMEGDLREPGFATKAVNGQEVVFHLAASHGGRGYIDTHPVECSTNMILDGVVFKAAHEAGVDRICFASSACVYPTVLQEKPVGNVIYLREEQADPFILGAAQSDGEYGWAKFMGEMTLKAYHKQYGQKGVSCRIFTAYGERENESHAVIAFIARAFIEQDPFVIWGDGEQDRNFTYVGDIVEGLMRACEHITDASPINIGTAVHISINETVKKVCEISGFVPQELKHDLTKPVGVFSRAADTSLIKKKLGWEPLVSLEEGLKRTITWYQRHRNKDEVKAELERLLTSR